MTTLVEQVADQIDTEVARLKGCVEFVADLAAVVEQKGLPSKEITAYVVDLGFDDLGGEAAAGIHTQMLNNAIGVIICVRSRGDAKAKRAVPVIDLLKTEVVNAVAGWAPANVSGVFEVTRGRLLSVSDGLIIYQLDFRIADQLRIEP